MVKECFALAALKLVRRPQNNRIVRLVQVKGMRINKIITIDSSSLTATGNYSERSMALEQTGAP